MSRTVSASVEFTTNLRFKTSHPRGGLPPIQMSLRLEAANLSRISAGCSLGLLVPLSHAGAVKHMTFGNERHSDRPMISFMISDVPP